MGKATIARAIWLKVFLAAGAGARQGNAVGASGGDGLLGCQSETGDRVLPGSSVVEQKAQATVPVALPCSNQGLTAPGPGCVCGAGPEDPHLPARE